MRPNAILRCFAVLSMTCVLYAQEATTTEPPPESDLVKASRAAKSKKQTPPKKPITNADLKKAKTKLIEHPLPPITTTDVTPPAASDKGPVAKADDQYHARKAAEGRVDVAAKLVTDLEHELERVEQAYYKENDPNFRDDVIQKRFAQTKRQLEAARKELADARDALLALK